MKKRADPSPRQPARATLRPEERKRSLAAGTQTPAAVDAAGLLSDLRSLIQSARQRIAAVAYSTQTLLCWHLGRRLLNEKLGGSRAAYGEQILVTVSQELTTEFGRGYLRWLDTHERALGEEAPIGLILCASADVEQVELLQLDAKSIRVSEYLTELLPLPLLRARLHQAIEHAREIAARRLPAAEDQP